MIVNQIHLNILFINYSHYAKNTFIIQLDQSINNMSNKKEKNQREQTIEKLKAEKEAYLKEAKEYKDRIRPLVNFLRTKKLKFSHAQVGNERVEYFRLDQFQKIVNENKEYIDNNEKLSQLVKKSSNEFVFFRRPDSIKIKYPKMLEPVMPNNVDRKYASFRFDTTESKHTMTILIILAILAIVMFPIWPYEVKYGIWLVSLILLIILVGIIIIRLIVYLAIVMFNYHIWIFPNFLNSTGFWDSFIPVLQISKGDKSWFNVFIRLFAVSSIMLLIIHAYLNPTFIEDNIAFTKQTISEVHDWGVSKLKNQGNFSQRALTNLETILNQTADVIQQTGQYQDNDKQYDTIISNTQKEVQNQQQQQQF